MDTPSTNENGYFDAMDLSMLAGKSWRWHTQQIPGYSPASYKDRFLYVGLRDVNDTQRKTVTEPDADVIWGDAEKHTNSAGELTAWRAFRRTSCFAGPPGFGRVE